MQLTRTILLAVLLPAVSLAVDRDGRRPEGGGSVAPGFTGEYFLGTDLDAGGTKRPVFTRPDLRVDFDWGTLRPIAGGLAPSWATFPRDNFSVRWTGAVIPRFSESYALTVEADDGVRLWVCAEGADWGPPRIDRWTVDGLRTDTASVDLVAGQRYQVRLEYREKTGAARARLRWSSASTPLETIEPVWMSMRTMFEAVDLANLAMDQGWPGPVDADGWPMADAALGADNYNNTNPDGRWRVQFRGRAKFSFGGGRGALDTITYFVGDKTFTGSLPAGEGYDPVTNLTQAEFTVTLKPGYDEPTWVQISLKETSRDGSVPAQGNGVTDIYVMKPSETDASVPDEIGMTASGILRKLMHDHSAVRYQELDGDATDWANRLPPKPIARGKSIEQRILRANECGRDIYLNIGTIATEDYIRKIAQAIRYGTDGVNPYTSEAVWPPEGPRFPPLNPNLHLYLEHGNEQGWSAIQGWMPNFAELSGPDRVADKAVVCYDNPGATSHDTYRWHAYRTVRISQIFREVFGDAAMHTRIRPALFGQYDGFQLARMCQFIDDYYNHGDPRSTWTGAPHPVSYYLWGGGGAVYFSANNVYGALPVEPVAEGSFDAPLLAVGTVQRAPSGTAWTFTGNAGICQEQAPRRAAITTHVLGTVANGLSVSTWTGFRFTVGAKDLFVYGLGRWVHAGNAQSHGFRIVATNGTTVSLQPPKLNLAGKTVGAFAYVPICTSRYVNQGDDSLRNAVVRLQAGQTYDLLCQELAGGDHFASDTTTLTTDPALTVVGAVTSVDGVAITVSRAGAFTGNLLDLLFADAPFITEQGLVGLPPDTSFMPSKRESGWKLGTQCAFLAGTGSISQQVQVPTAGYYSVIFHSVVSPVAANPIRISVIDANGHSQVAWDSEVPDGGSRKTMNGFGIYGTDGVFLSAGACTIRFEGMATDRLGKATPTNAAIFLGRVSLGSFDALNDSIPNGGSAAVGSNSKNFPNTAKAMATMALSWGLEPFAYEGGFSAGGDTDQENMRFWSWSQTQDPGYVQAHHRAVETWQRCGGRNFMEWYGIDPMDLAAIREENDRLPMEGDGFNAHLPGISLTAYNFHRSGYIGNRWNALSAGSVLTNGDWMSWNVVVPCAGRYRLDAHTIGVGTFRVAVDECQDLSPSGSGGSDMGLSGAVLLTKGLHTVKLTGIDGQTDVRDLWLQPDTGASLRPMSSVGIPTASSISSSSGDGFAIDDSMLSGWISAQAGTQTLRLDLRAAIPIHGVSLVWMPGRHATAFRVEVSNDGNFASGVSNICETATGDGARVVLELTPPAVAQYLRVVMTQPALGQTAYGIADISIMGLPIEPVAGLVSRWNFESNLYDTASLGTANPGAMTNSASYSTDRMVGSTCLYLDGVSQQVTIADQSDLDPSGSFTLAAWIKPGGVTGTILLKPGQYRLAADGSNLTFTVTDTTGSTHNVSWTYASSSFKDLWTHVVAGYDRGAGRQFLTINGTTTRTGTWIGDPALGVAALQIGGEANGSGRFLGYIDDLRLYHQALGADTTAALWEWTDRITVRKLSTTVTVSSDRSYTVANAVDDTAGTRWRSAGKGTEWVQLDFGVSRSVDRVVVVFDTGNYAKTYELLLGDQADFAAGTYRTLFSTTNGVGGRTEVASLRGAGRYLRLSMSVANGSDYRVCDLQAFPPLSANSADTDADGMPDWWEYLHYLSPMNAAGDYGPDGDPDGDGMSNTAEYVADTDPNDGTSCLAITSLLIDTNSIAIEWKGGTDVTQYVEKTTSLVAGVSAWTPVYTNPPPTLQHSLVTHLDITNSPVYYRIRATR